MQSENPLIADFVKLMNAAAGTLAGMGREARDSARERMRARVERFLQAEFPQSGRCDVLAVGGRASRVRKPIGDADLRPGGTVSGPVLMSVADLALYVAIFGEIGIVGVGRTYAGVTRDLSLGGAFIATELDLPAGSSVELRLHLPGSEGPLRCLGEVRWSRGPGENSGASAGIGLRFVLLEADARRVLGAFLAEHTPPDAED